MARSSGDVFAAGQPAAILLLALAPDRLIGWPRRPEPKALAMLSGADLPETGALAGGGAPAGLEAVATRRPALIVDYGDTDRRFRSLARQLEERLRTPYHLLDGALYRIPEAFLRAGSLLGRETRGSQLADRATSTLAESRKRTGGPSFYYARGRDGLETGFAGSLATEVLERAGWHNVATGGNDIGRVSRERIAAWDPEVVVTLDGGFAERWASDALWLQRRSGVRRKLLLLPDLPFGWIDQPPSINRLLGCAWLAGGDGGNAAARTLASELWDIAPDRLATLPMPRWLA